MNHKALWDTINEGGEGYRPAYARTAPRKAATRMPGTDRYLANGERASKIEARIAKDTARLVGLTGAARQMTAERIAADRKLLEG